jgi:prepilin-type N-terminal cleavage/methylation domain-containing protein
MTMSSQMRKGRGFTLVEVVMVTVLSAVLILMSIGWAASLAVTSTNALAQSGNTTNAAYITSRLGSDLLGAVDCNQYGLDTPFYSFSPSQIAFYEKVGSASTTLSGAPAVTSTVSSAQANAGATAINLVSTTGIIVGQEMLIGSPIGVNDIVTVTSLGTGTVSFSPALAHTYISGTPSEVPGASLSPSSTTGIGPGTVLTIGTGASQESSTVSYVSGSTVHLVQPMTYLHSSGETVSFTGSTDLVAWRVSADVLQRAVITESGACSASGFASGYATATWVTIATGVNCQLTSTRGAGENCITGAPSDPIYFQAYSKGTLQSGGTVSAPLNCTGSGASACYFDTVSFTAQLVAAGTAKATSPFSQSFSVNLSGSHLGANS